MPSNRIKIIFSLSLIFLFFAHNTYAFSSPKNDLKSPYNSIWAHLHYLQVDTYNSEEAIKPFKLESEPKQALELANNLLQIFDWKGLYVDIEKVPKDSMYIDSLEQKPIYYPFKGDLPDVYLIKQNDQWVYSKHTLERIPTIHKEMGLIKSAILSVFPKIGHNAFLGIEVWQYIGIFTLIILFFLIHFLLSSVLSPIVKNYAQKILKGKLGNQINIQKITKLLSYFILLQLLRLAIPMLQLGLDVSALIGKGLNILSTIIVLLIALQILKIGVRITTKITDKTESKMDDQLVPLLEKFARIVIIGLAVLQILSYAGVNITALLAGVSIGGLAVALAAQDTVKNLLGSAMIFMDRPFQVGDFVSGPDFSGTIVEVGFRSTRIKTVGSSIVSIPNGVVANATIDNFGVRSFRLYQTTLGLTYDTDAVKIEAFKAGLTKILQDEPVVHDQDIMIYFTEFAASSLNLYFKAPIRVASFDEELQVKERINIKILQLAAELSVDFAFPSTSVYIEKN